MYLVLKCPYNISYLCCSAIVVIDREEEHDTKHRGWQHGKQVGLKAPNILDGPNTRNAKFLQKQIHHLEQGCTPNSRFNEIKNLRIGLQWQPSLLLCHRFCCNTNYFHWRTLHRYTCTLDMASEMTDHQITAHYLTAPVILKLFNGWRLGKIYISSDG